MPNGPCERTWAFHIYLRNCRKEQQRTGLESPARTPLHTSILGRYCTVWPLIHPSFHSSYQQYSAICQTHCPTRHCVAFRWPEHSALLQGAFGKWKSKCRKPWQFEMHVHSAATGYKKSCFGFEIDANLFFFFFNLYNTVFPVRFYSACGPHYLKQRPPPLPP